MLHRQDNLSSRFDCDIVRGHHVIVGFSGGADSVSLLHYLWQHRQELNCTVEAAHLNHCLRGEESDRDEEFVRNFCEERNIPLTVRRLDIASLARKKGLSEETCGREMRYLFFWEMYDPEEAEHIRIATAHTLSDDLETVLFRMARGTGLDGLCGIPAVRGNIVRPLLRCTREMVEEYCAAENLSFVTDSTNGDRNYARNRIRLEAVPALKAVNEAAEENFLRQKEILSEERDFLEQETQKLLKEAACAGGYRTEMLRQAHPALRHRAAAVILRGYHVPVNQNNIKILSRLIEAGKGSAELRPGFAFAVRRGILQSEYDTEVRIIRMSVEKSVLEDGMIHSLTVESVISAGEIVDKEQKNLYLQVIPAKEWTNTQKVYENLLFFALDYDTIIGGLTFRARMAGDSLAQPSRGRRPLRKLYSEAGLTVFDRQRRLVAADDLSVVWAEGFEPDRRVTVNEKTERVLLGFRALPEIK